MVRIDKVKQSLQGQQQEAKHQGSGTQGRRGGFAPGISSSIPGPKLINAFLSNPSNLSTSFGCITLPCGFWNCCISPRTLDHHIESKKLQSHQKERKPAMVLSAIISSCFSSETSDPLSGTLIIAPLHSRIHSLVPQIVVRAHLCQPLTLQGDGRSVCSVRRDAARQRPVNGSGQRAATRSKRGLICRVTPAHLRRLSVSLPTTKSP